MRHCSFLALRLRAELCSLPIVCRVSPRLNGFSSQPGYFLVDFYAPPTAVSNIIDHLGRDIDVIRPTILKHEEEKRPEKPCTGMEPPTNLEEKFRTRKRK
ncbi:hypothetical protein AB205_0052550 [Aquarana catesbeiana]|uniref:28S ribosomal protein S6, mitochondrial n=1 Tax=Aquarana catesbeiana TaxID=8400 RepID=A0A2G9SA96_AQUCT|nr:hypothetical protein AB205_0052550 [Aquarana catesbeiana]